MKKAKSRQKSKKNIGRGQVKRADKSIEILGVTIFGTHKREVLKKIWLLREKMLHVATVNPEYIMEARRNPRFKMILSQCLTVADGHGVVWASQILNHKFANSQMRYKYQIERISGVEIVEEILVRANKLGEKIFLLGAQLGVAEKAARAMSAKYPGVKLAWYEGARTVAVEASTEASMTIAKINGFEPDYLLVAYGSPWQDVWIEENRPYLRARVAMGVGGTLDEWAGEVSKCPMWVDQMGLKWTWRVMHEPWRWKRVMKVFQFSCLVMYHKLID